MGWSGYLSFACFLVGRKTRGFQELVCSDGLSCDFEISIEVMLYIITKQFVVI